MTVWRSVASVVSLLLATSLVAAESDPSKLQAKASKSFTKSSSIAEKLYIVELQNKPTLVLQRKAILAKREGRIGQQSLVSQLAEQKRIIRAQQDALEARLVRASRSSKSLKRYHTVINAMAVQTSLTKEQLETLQDVKAVYPVQRYRAYLDRGLEIIDAASAWQFVGGEDQAGQGIRVAIIDSGIIPDHPMFDDSGFTAPAELPQSYCQQGDTEFVCNNKLIVARHYLPYFLEEQQDFDASGEFDSPLGLSGHGTHVAGIATGRRVTDNVEGRSISGVAPGAYLMAYKALWGQDGEGTDLELLSALEDAANDGADVINNSWGGGPGGNPAQTRYKAIFEGLEQAGIVVVSAAGNEGALGISCPGCVESGITVGATTTDFKRVNEVSFNQQTLFSSPGDNVSSLKITATAKASEGENIRGCSAFPANHFAEQIAVIERGICNFEDKANHAADAGAVAMVVYNNANDGLIGMVMGSATLPSVFINLEDGAVLLNAIAQDASTLVTLTNQVTNSAENQDELADFSSVGPNGDTSFIKPDLVAPGYAILSATSPYDLLSLDLDYERQSGTSMASPMVAGAAAVLLGNDEDLSPRAVKGLLVNSSEPVAKAVNGVRSATPFEAGAGRMNLARALSASAYADVPNLANNACYRSCEITSKLVQISEQGSWQAEVTINDSRLEGYVVPSSMTLQAGNEQAFSLVVHTPTNIEPGWVFGRVNWTNQDGEVLTQAVAVYTKGGSSDTLLVDIEENDTDGYSVIVDALNDSESDTMNFDITTQGSAKIVTGSVVVTGNNEATSKLSNEGRTLTVTAEVPAGGIDIISATAPFNIDISTKDGVEAIACDLNDSCDEVLYGFDLAEFGFSFKHFGATYDELWMNDNGLVIVGGIDDLPESVELYINQEMPDVAAPNNVIAPFWSDFDLANVANEADTGGGFMYIDVIVHNDVRYLVLQWHQAQLYTDANATPEVLGISSADVAFTFQLIIEEGSENKWFNYIDMPEVPNFYTVGLENSTGTIGTSHWYDNSESGLESGQALAVAAGNLGSIRIAFDIEQASDNPFATDDNYMVTEDQSQTLAVLINDLSAGAGVEVSVADESFYSPLFENVEGSLVTSTLAIEQQPEHGTVSISSNGTLEYTPDENYVGQDSLVYAIENSAGQTDSATVQLVIVNVNDAPEASQILVSGKLIEGETLDFSVEATDIDDDTLVYEWTFPSELVRDAQNGSAVSAKVEGIDETVTVDVSVSVFDGEASTVRTVTLTLEPKDDDKGLLGLAMEPWWLLIMLLGLGRRVAIKKD